MEIVKAIILGIIQGLTEFLPVSSSGHIELGKIVLNADFLAEENLLFTVLVHFATVLSTWLAIRESKARAESDLQRKHAEEQSNRAESSERDAQLRFAEEQLAAGKSAMGIAKLAQLVRKEPNNHIAGERRRNRSRRPRRARAQRWQIQLLLSYSCLPECRV